MKRRTQKIDKVVSLALSEERCFGQEAGKSQHRLNEQLARLGELNAYRRSYQQKSPIASGMSGVHCQDYHNFLQRLDHAVRSQQQVIRECEQNVEVHRRCWMLKRQRLESLQRVLDAHRAEDAAYAARLDQKQQDNRPYKSRSIFDGND